MQMSEITIEVNEVESCLQNLKSSRVSGPDEIPARLLKECSQQLAHSLCSLFNKSLQVSRLPSEWKNANVIPIHKLRRIIKS